jgi:hypothetical protein
MPPMPTFWARQVAGHRNRTMNFLNMVNRFVMKRQTK